MGDFEESKRIVAPVRKPTLKEAVSKAVRSFDTSSLDGKFEMTIHEGFRVYLAMNRVFKALENLEKTANAVPSSWND